MADPASSRVEAWVCIATGPSLTQEDVDLCRGLNAVCVNDAWRMAPWAGHLYAADRKWWDVNVGAVRAGFHGQTWTCDAHAVKRYKLTHVKALPHPFLSTTPGVIHTGRNSGYQAINLAYMLGARRVVLLGYDMQRTGGRGHFFGDHPRGLRNDDPGQYVGCFNAMQPERVGLEVINCTRETALRCFPRKRLEDVLASLRCAAA